MYLLSTRTYLTDIDVCDCRLNKEKLSSESTKCELASLCNRVEAQNTRLVKAQESLVEERQRNKELNRRLVRDGGMVTS